MDEAEEEETTEFTQEEDEEQLGASELPSCVIRRVLTGNKKRTPYKSEVAANQYIPHPVRTWGQGTERNHW